MPSLTAVCASGPRSLLLASRNSRALAGSVGRAPPTPSTLSAASGSATATASSPPLLRHGSVRASSSSRPVPFALPPPSRPAAVFHNYHTRPPLQLALRYPWTSDGARGMMSKAAPRGDGGREGGAEAGAGGKKEQEGEGEYDDAEYEPEEEKIGVVKMVGGLLLLGVVVAAIGATAMELMPTHMAPQSIMSRAHDMFQADPDTANHFGTPLKVYGRDHNRHREGRRNFVEHVDHEDPMDGSKRTRVRFNVEGPHGHGMAYAEVSNKMSKGEWVYLCVQDMQTGHVITLHDNRAMLIAQAQAGSDEEKNAFRKMLGQ